MNQHLPRGLTILLSIPFSINNGHEGFSAWHLLIEADRRDRDAKREFLNIHIVGQGEVSRVVLKAVMVTSTGGGDEPTLVENFPAQAFCLQFLCEPRSWHPICFSISAAVHSVLLHTTSMMTRSKALMPAILFAALLCFAAAQCT